MDIFAFAIEKEKLSEDNYHLLADKTSNKGLQNIFTMLAAEEKKHIQIVQDMQKNSSVTVAETPVLDDAQKIFESMRQAAEHFNFDVDEGQLYQKAAQIETESEMYYRKKAKQVTNPQHRDIFLKLAEEEHKHFLLLESICTFVEKSKWFLEDAEMDHFDDYAEGTL